MNHHNKTTRNCDARWGHPWRWVRIPLLLVALLSMSGLLTTVRASLKSLPSTGASLRQKRHSLPELPREWRWKRSEHRFDDMFRQRSASGPPRPWFQLKSGSKTQI